MMKYINKSELKCFLSSISFGIVVSVLVLISLEYSKIGEYSPSIFFKMTPGYQSCVQEYEQLKRSISLDCSNYSENEAKKEYYSQTPACFYYKGSMNNKQLRSSMLEYELKNRMCSEQYVKANPKIVEKWEQQKKESDTSVRTETMVLAAIAFGLLVAYKEWKDRKTNNQLNV